LRDQGRLFRSQDWIGWFDEELNKLDENAVES
jgi:hypothetical protein